MEHIQVRDGKFAVTLNDYADLAEGALLAAVERNGAPVSYTHLDVYKRQAEKPGRKLALDLPPAHKP